MTFYLVMFSFFVGTGAAMGADLIRLRHRRRPGELHLAPVIEIDRRRRHAVPR